MRRWLQRILTPPVLWLNHRWNAQPDKTRIFAELSDLCSRILNGEKDKGVVVPFEAATGRFIIFSDQHKGSRNGADDFQVCEGAYLAALDHYHNEGYHLILLGDCEELWENLLPSITTAYANVFESEKRFVHRNALIKIFGNHDLFWDNDPLASLQLSSLYGASFPVHEGVVLETILPGGKLRIFCTHGHQGDAVSDGNWFSKFFVSRVWAPLQAFLRINPNTPAYDAQLKNEHNRIMYDWSAEQDSAVLITGHTHQPVFASLTHIERLYRQWQYARASGDAGKQSLIEDEIRERKFAFDRVAEDYGGLKPAYFNSGCCCYVHGAITGIEIAEGSIRLVEWKSGPNAMERLLLEEMELQALASMLQNGQAVAESQPST